VHTGRTRHQREVRSIVDHDRCAEAVGSGNDRVTQFEESIGGKCLRPQLNGPGATVQKSARQIDGLPARPRRDVDVDDSLERGKEDQAVSARLLFFCCGMNRSMKDVLSRPA
jgi:hypothetical protein